MIVAQPLRKELRAALEQVLDKNNFILLARTQAQSDVQACEIGVAQHDT
jgi:hypothetical protein